MATKTLFTKFFSKKQTIGLQIVLIFISLISFIYLASIPFKKLNITDPEPTIHYPQPARFT